MKKYLLFTHIFFLSTVALTQENNLKKDIPAVKNQNTTHPEWLKLSPALRSRLSDSTSALSYIYTLSVADTTLFRHFTEQYKATVHIKGTWPEAQVYLVQMPAQLFHQQALTAPWLQFADCRRTKPHEELAVPSFNHTFNTINTLQAAYPQLTGDAFTVSVKENLFDTTDIDFLHRIINTGTGSSVTASHASTIATLIGGAGNTYYTSLGVARGVTLSSASFDILLPDTTAYSKYAISVQNHSYGVDIENYYGSDAAAYDASMLKDTVLMHVFSSGNIGTDTAVGGNYDGIAGYSNLSGSFKMAKNVLTVGSLDTSFSVASLSSRGPAYDGRIKPDLVAYGEDGSSGAAALTSGAVLLLQQAYSLQHNGNKPGGALIKAVLVNTAEDLLTEGPDYISGYGALNAWKAATAMLQQHYIQGNIQQNQVQSYPIHIPSGVAGVSVTLAWNDLPATANAATALVNDLDLTLCQTGSGRSWQPWVLHSTASIDSITLPATRGRDSLNVAEKITLQLPEAGDYLIQVNGTHISNSQHYSIAWQYDTLNRFYWTSPVHIDNFLPSASNVFKWEYHGSETKGELAITYDKGNSWQMIDPQVNLTAPYYRWNTPDTFATAIARMTVGNQVYLTDTFTVSYQKYPSVGFNCADSLLLYWQRVPEAAYYRLYQVKDKYLEVVQDHLTDTTTIVYQPTTGASYYAVAPVTADGLTGGLSYAVNYEQQGVACYFYGLLADLQADNTGLITAQLGSLYHIQTIGFEKQKGNGWTPLTSFAIGEKNTWSFTDSNLISGPNTYRGVLTTITGSHIYSDAATLYYWKNNDDYILYPNPLGKGQLLQLLSKDPFNKSVVIYDMNGKQVWQQTIADNLEQLSLSALAPGVYLVVVNGNGRRLAVRKLVVQ